MEMTMYAEPADDGATARFTPAPDELMAELADMLATPPHTFGGADVCGYPFRLVSCRLKHVLNSTGTELPGLARKGTTNPAYMHPDDVAELGLTSGDLVEIRSPRAAVRGVVETADDVKRGVVSMAHSWGGSSLTDEKVRDIGTPTSRLVSVDAAHDPVTGMVVSSAIPVAVSPIAHDEAATEGVM
jgi:anaerobic selenocysteine-containing dehydrogenase